MNTIIGKIEKKSFEFSLFEFEFDQRSKGFSFFNIDTYLNCRSMLQVFYIEGSLIIDILFLRFHYIPRR